MKMRIGYWAMILLICGFVTFFTVEREDYDIAFKKTWVYLSDEYFVKYEAYHLPPHIVAHINGDGKKEVLVVTNYAKIKVFYLLIQDF